MAPLLRTTAASVDAGGRVPRLDLDSLTLAAICGSVLVTGTRLLTAILHRV